MAVAPPRYGGASVATAADAVAVAPAETSPDATSAAARRTAPRPRMDNAANTEFPSGQDRFTWGDGSRQQTRPSRVTCRALHSGINCLTEPRPAS
ncbi:hypothetical protein GCM10010245_70550 [Streptomyces spectabilis]|nr:hypothetical protein GCM10010245_70550 [Streptomyces spectabilis]